MSRRNFLMLLIPVLWGTIGPTSQAFAQYSGGQSRSMYNATRNFLYNRPTVSPYVNLATRDNYNGMPNYFTIVRPQIEQREREMTQRQETSRMQTQLNQVQRQQAQSQSQMAEMMLTGRVGWSSRGMPRFGSYMNYFPGFQQVPRR